MPATYLGAHTISLTKNTTQSNDMQGKQGQIHLCSTQPLIHYKYTLLLHYQIIKQLTNPFSSSFSCS
jgi:hypothetical protein